MKKLSRKWNCLVATILAVVMIVSNFGGLAPLTAYASGSEDGQSEEQPKEQTEASARKRKKRFRLPQEMRLYRLKLQRKKTVSPERRYLPNPKRLRISPRHPDRRIPRLRSSRKIHRKKLNPKRS